MPRRRIVYLQDLAADLRASVRRRRPAAPPAPAAQAPDGRTAEELERRLDATRERLRREIPPPEGD